MDDRSGKMDEPLTIAAMRAAASPADPSRAGQ